VVSPIGEGGMGEVYRARDTRLKREVALKILPPSVAADSDRVARFAREAEVLAALNHPNIANIYGVETSGGTQALVMELVEGEDLAARIARPSTFAQGVPSGVEGRGLPLDEALAIARQIVDALEAAHERGIVHRDLKPANIKIRPDGTVKVLDFGLAKTIDAPQAGSDVTYAGSITSPAMTHVGMILGTAAYMSPEQARGLPADKRSDIWAFGCVLFEMLSGARPFPGDTISDTLASVLKTDPDLAALPATTPAPVRLLLQLCLTKPQGRRLRDIGDARVFLDPAMPATDSPRATTAPRVSLWRRVLPWAIAAGAFIVAIAAVTMLVRRAAPAPTAFMFDIETATAGDIGGFALSPDGRYLVFNALDADGVQRLFLRALDDATSRVLAGTDGATSPFWSPDSHDIAFFTTTTLRRIAIQGGATQQICQTVGPFASGGSWNADNVILFSRGSTGNGLFRVAAGGGEPEAVTTVRAPGEVSHSAPLFLPDNRHFLYSKVMAGASLETSQLIWRSLDSGEEHVVRQLFSKALYVLPGYLIFRLPGALLAQPFDASTGKVTGDPARIGPDVWASASGAEAPARAMATVAASGPLAYRAGGEGTWAALSWVDRSGAVLSRVADRADYSNPSTDASGTRVMANTVAADSGTADLWLFDSRRDTASRFTFDPAMDSDAIFSPDGKSVVYYSARQPPGLYRKSSTGGGEETLLAATGAQTYPRDWTRDGRVIEFDRGNRPSTSIWFLPMEGATAGKPFAFAPGPYYHAQGHFSPDGRWLAYVSGESGHDEIFVQDFPPAGAKMQVSSSGGIEPRWRADGRELYYIAGDGKLMVVTVDGGHDLRLSVAKPLFDTHFATGVLPFPMRRFAVAPAGDRFLINVPIERRQAPITVVTNWTSRLPH